MLRLRHGSTLDTAVALVGAAPVDAIIRDFDDPFLEFVRLLRGAAEIEHALLVQYLYCAFSVRAEYELVSGPPVPGSTDLMGIAIEEMQHLHTVNRILVSMQAAPGLVSQSFPYQPEIYPFPMHLEAISRTSVAKYVFTEAPAGALDRSDPANELELPFLELLFDHLGDTRPNHLGSLYRTLIRLARELDADNDPRIPDLESVVIAFERIKGQGEIDHFQLFKQVFLGTHEGFLGRDVWSFAPSDPEYPGLNVPTDPVAYEEHPGQIEDENARRLAWLGNLQYWLVLMLLNLSYCRPDVLAYAASAQAHMEGPLWALGRHLPTIGAGLPFDPLGMGYSPGIDPASNLIIVRRLIAEARRYTDALTDVLPPAYPWETDLETLNSLGDIG